MAGAGAGVERGLGCLICFAAQAGSQLDAVYGPLQGSDVMESAAFWAGKATRSHQSYGANGDDRGTARQFGNALEAAELLPRNIGEARLIPRGQPGQMVELIDFDEFVVYFDELRAVGDGRAPIDRGSSRS